MKSSSHNQPLISCLTATFGRLTQLQEAVSCFLDQDWLNKELIVFNDHPVPLTCDLPGVRVYNEPPKPCLGSCRNRLLELAVGEYIRCWDDDDLYLPWTLSQGMENIGSAPAWKPARSWHWHKGNPPELAGNVFESSILIRRELAVKYGYSETDGFEHRQLFDGLEREGGIKTAEMNLQSSYIYRWGWGMWHHSGSFNSGQSLATRTSVWRGHNNDADDGAIRRVPLAEYWTSFQESFEAYRGITRGG